MGVNAAKKLSESYRRPFRVGFVPLLDCAPLVVAKEMGLFARHGVDVSLVRQPGWASVRDKLVSGELEASQAVSALAFATTYGLGCAPGACVTALMLNTHGNGITLSKKLVGMEIRSGAVLARAIRSGEVDAPLVFGVVHPYSSHNFLLRGWLKAAGIEIDREVRIVTVPPSLMGRNLAAGNLDGYCVGEPWNTASIEAGYGECIATSAELSPMHPEKVFLVRRDVAERCVEEHLAMVRALIDACAFCDDPANFREIARMLSRTEYVNLPEGLLGKSLDGFGNGQRRMNLFSGGDVNRPSGEKANWILNQMTACGLAPEKGLKGRVSPADIFLPGLYDEACEAPTGVV